MLNTSSPGEAEEDRASSLNISPHRGWKDQTCRCSSEKGSASVFFLRSESAAA